MKKWNKALQKALAKGNKENQRLSAGRTFFIGCGFQSTGIPLRLFGSESNLCRFSACPRHLSWDGLVLFSGGILPCPGGYALFRATGRAWL